MAFEAEKLYIREKIQKLVAAKFDGDSRAAFVYYDTKNDGKIDRAELSDLLKDAGIGNWLTRGRWAEGIIAALDTDKDGGISMADLDASAN